MKIIQIHTKDLVCQIAEINCSHEAYLDPSDTSVLSVSFSESPPEEFKSDPSEVSSETVMSAGENSRL